MHEHGGAAVEVTGWALSEGGRWRSGDRSVMLSKAVLMLDSMTSILEVHVDRW